MIQFDKKIDDMDYEELEGLQKELEQDINEKEQDIKEYNYVLTHVIDKINEMDAQDE